MDDRKQYQIRFSDAERETFKSVAQANGETTANWIRRTLLAEARKVQLNPRPLVTKDNSDG